MAKGNKKKANAKKPKTNIDKKLKTNLTTRKKNKRSRNKVKVFEHDYPSRYGSHASMISEWVRPLDNDLVICEDEQGLYVTNIRCLDSGIADPKRWSNKAFRDGVYDSIEKVVDPSKNKSKDENNE